MHLVLKLDQYCLCTHEPSDRPVFRVGKACEHDKLKVESSKHTKRNSRLTIPENNWKEFTDNEAGETHVLEGGSLLIEGIAGTGKGTFAKGIVERLVRLGKKVAVISKHTLPVAGSMAPLLIFGVANTYWEAVPHVMSCGSTRSVN